MPRPTLKGEPASIGFVVESKTGKVEYESPYVPRDQAWIGKPGRPWNPGLVLYALADDGFAVWDPARNYWKCRGNIDIQDRVPGFVFSAREVWDGLQILIGERRTLVCNGLLVDWASWIREKGEDARRMGAVLPLLGPTVGGRKLEVGRGLARLSVNDARDIPTLHTGYGQEVPILHASFGVRRITTLAYMLSWAWREHRIAAAQLGEAPSARIVLLFDEIEAHLHPQWQRAIVPALLNVVRTLTEDAAAEVQLIAATHSPLVMASVEPLFDLEEDAWFDLDLENWAVVLRKREFVRHGEVGNWLTSEAFDLEEPRSLEGEQAIQAALSVIRDSHSTEADILAVQRRLHAAGLPDIDPF